MTRGPCRVMTRRTWSRVRALGGLGILTLVLWRVGADGFRDGLRLLDPGVLLAASGIGLLTTTVSAWRWRLVARRLGIALPLPGAVAAYYRATFLNTTLPGGILGDVHRGVRHGRDLGDLGLGVRAVVLERVAGQVVLVATAAVVLVTLPGPTLSPPLPAALGPTLAVLVGVVAVAAVLAGRRLRRSTSRWGRAFRTTASAVRVGLLSRRAWPGVVISSTAVLAGYLAIFVLAARAAGSTLPTVALLSLLVPALLAMAVPLNVGGWGPREGVCAWAFGAAGLGADQGVTVAVVYGVSILVASLPGAAVLAARWFTGRRTGDYAAAGPALKRSDNA